MIKFWDKCFKFISNLFTYLYLRYYDINTEFGYVAMHGIPIIIKHKKATIKLGKGVTLISTSKQNVAGINHPVILAALTENSIIDIGKVGISGASICCVCHVKIGNNSGIGANSKIYDTDFHPISPAQRLMQNSIYDAAYKEVIIGENVWISSDVTILKGVKIGDESVVGAGSIVTKDIPSKCIYAGNPARFIRQID